MKKIFLGVVCLLILQSLQSQALTINGCDIEPGTSCNEVNLHGLDLSYLDLADASFKRANFKDSFLSYADLTNVKFLGADLTDADLSSAILIGTNFKRADLINANLSNANITNAFFKFTDLSGADLSNVVGWDTATFNRAYFNSQTIFPNQLIPHELNMNLVPIPASVHLLLSGLVALVSAKLRGRSG